jgi:serine/threonine-protein kinase
LTQAGEDRLKAREGSVLDGKWTLERLLGAGGMAAVYAARHRNGARAAVKILHPELSRHAEVRERFLREGYAANQVEHPGVVKVLDDDSVAEGPDKGTTYIVMELLEGESLQSRLERGPPIGEVEFLELAANVLEVLDAAHARGVVHRDLKPENLFLARPEGDLMGPPQVKILDFGLARLLQNQAITTYGLALGTPSFMSPEQAAGRTDEIDGRTDIFALGVAGFRLRSGRRIHEADNAVELVTKMSKVPAPRLASVTPDVSEPYARVIDRALEFRREDRYETAAAMLKDVRRAIAQLEGNPDATELAVPASVRSVRRPPAQGDTIDVSEGNVVPSRTDESIRIPKRRSVLPWLLLVALFGVGAKVWGATVWSKARELWTASRGGGAASPAASASAAGAPAVDAAASAGTAALPPAQAQALEAGTTADGSQVSGARTDAAAPPAPRPTVAAPATTKRAVPGKPAPARPAAPKKPHAGTKPAPGH